MCVSMCLCVCVCVLNTCMSICVCNACVMCRRMPLCVCTEDLCTLHVFLWFWRSVFSWMWGFHFLIRGGIQQAPAILPSLPLRERGLKACTAHPACAMSIALELQSPGLYSECSWPCREQVQSKHMALRKGASCPAACNLTSLSRYCHESPVQQRTLKSEKSHHLKTALKLQFNLNW